MWPLCLSRPLTCPHSPLVLLARSVSSTLSTKPASLPSPKSRSPFRATSQLYSAVRAPPTWSDPVGDGANLIRGSSSRTFLPALGKSVPPGPPSFAPAAVSATAAAVDPSAPSR